MVAVGDKIMQQCNSGFEPAPGYNATVTSLCGKDGHWTNTLLCEKQLECCNLGMTKNYILVVLAMYLM
jgi:hypothetical protein